MAWLLTKRLEVRVLPLELNKSRVDFGMAIVTKECAFNDLVFNYLPPSSSTIIDGERLGRWVAMVEDKCRNATVISTDFALTSFSFYSLLFRFLTISGNEYHILLTF